MADQTGLVIQGNEKNNHLTVKVVQEDNGDRSIYNVIHAGDGEDTLSGTLFRGGDVISQYGVQLFGENGDDSITGSNGADTLSGGLGDDAIYYTRGDDTIDGGDGFDRFRMESNLSFRHYGLNGLSMTGVEEIVVHDTTTVGDFDMNSVDVFRTDELQLSRPAHLRFSAQANVTDPVFKSSYGWELMGSKFDDVFDLSNSTPYFSIRGGGGDDLVIGGSGHNNFSGQDGNDTLTGGAKADDLTGGSGDDVLSANGGNDVVLAGIGNDIISGGDGDDRIYVGSGDDVVHADAGDDLISGGPGPASVKDFKILDGGAGDDIFTGFGFDAQSRSRILGGEGQDTISLGGDVSHLVVKGVETLDFSGHKIIADADTLDGFDRFIGIKDAQLTIQFSSGGKFTWDTSSEKQSDSALIASKEADHIDMTAARDFWTINGGGGNDTIIGPSDKNFIENIDGGSGNDTLTGGRFLDEIYGGAGNDVLVASKGNDGLFGQAGRDTFVFSDDIGTTTIVNYDNSGKDRDIIDLSAAHSIKDFDDMIAHHIVMKFDGHWLTIQLDKGEIALHGVKASDLDEAAFIF